MNSFSIIIQARLTSTRLPKKILLNLGENNSIDFLIHRLSKCENVSEIIFAIPNTSENDELETFLRKENANISEDLRMMLQADTLMPAKNIM